MCGIRSLAIVVLLGTVACPATGSAASDIPGTGGLCAQLDPSSRLEGLEYFPQLKSRVQRDYREPVGLAAVREALPGFLSDLEQRDPVMRIEAVARFAKARAWIPPGNNAAELDQWLIDRLRRESQGQVVEAIIRVLGERTDTPDLAPILIELIQCDRDPDLRSAALEVASTVSDPRLLEPLIGAWRTDAARVDRASALRALVRLKDRRSLDVAMEGLEEGFLEAVPLTRAVGTQKDVSRIIAIYNKFPRPLSIVNRGVVYLIGDLGGPDALAFLRTEFARSEGDDRNQLAWLALRAQLEPGKPEWTAADQRNCVPLDAIWSKRLPYVHKEVDRLLRDENKPFFRLLVWQPYQEIGGSFREWSRHLDPARRVKHWRRVVSLLGGNPSKEWSPAAEPTGQLVKALASRASLEAPNNAAAALRDIDEAIALSRTAYSNESSTADVLRDIRVRVERLLRSSAKETDADSAWQHRGTYSRSTGVEGHTLQFNEDGTFRYQGQSDAIDMCAMGRWTFEGTFHLEEGYLAVEPGPSMKRYGIDAPDLLKPVVVGDRHYLVEESQLVDFWRLEREGRLPANNRFFYVGSTPEASVHSMPAQAVHADRE